MNFGENVTILEQGDKKIYLIGTAHISQKSVEEVAQVISEVRPDTVCVELCETRYRTITDDSHWKKMNIIDIVKQGKSLMLMASLALSAFQRKLGEKLGVKPGSELRMAITKAEEVGAKLVLADRDIQVTLKRTWANLSFWKKMTVLGGLTESVFVQEEISEEELEKMKERDHLSDMMSEFAKAMPDIKGPLIDERDQYLMSKIQDAPGNSIVAVVGAGHVPGMQQYFGQEIDIQKISIIPPPSTLVKVLKWVIPGIILAMFAVGISRNQGREWQELLAAWLLPNMIGAGLFALIAGAKPLTTLISAIAAPITSLNPTIGAGMVGGLVEAWLRKPTVADCERIPEDVQSVRGVYRNAFTRVLLVVILVSLGSALGTYIGGAWLASIIMGGQQ